MDVSVETPSVNVTDKARDQDVTKALSGLDPLIDRDTDLRQLRLCFVVLGHGGNKLENVTQLLQFYCILLSSPTHKDLAIPLIHYMLVNIIGVHDSKGLDLLKCDEKELEKCEPVLAFPHAVVGVCKGLRKDDFEKLKVALCRDHLGINPVNVDTPEDLLLKLYHKTAVTACNVSLLAKWLKHTSVGRDDLADDIVMVYARKYAFCRFLEKNIDDKLNRDTFDKLCSLCCQELKCESSDISSPRLLVAKLHKSKMISLDDSVLLIDWLQHESINCCDLAETITKHTSEYKTQTPDLSSRLNLGTTPVQVSGTCGDESQLASGLVAGRDPSVISAVVSARGPTQDVQGKAQSDDIPSLLKNDLGYHDDNEQDATHHQSPSKNSGFDSAALLHHPQSATGTSVHGDSKPDPPPVSSPPPSKLTYPPPFVSRDTNLNDQSPSLKRQDSNGSRSLETDKLLEDTESEKPGVSLMVLHEPQENEDKKFKKCLCCLCVFLSLFIFVLIVCLVVAVGIGIYGWYCTIGKSQLLAKGGDSVVVATITDPLWLVFNSVKECPRDGDESHTNNLYLIEQSQLQPRTGIRLRNSSEILNLSEPSCKAGVLGTETHLYLLSGSLIEYRICLSSDVETNEHGTLYIFDNDISYQDYIDQDYPCTEDQAARKHDLIIGTPGKFECTNISLIASRNGYHYVLSRTPGNIQYSFTYNVSVRYLNPTDFTDVYCTFHSSMTHNLCVLPKLFGRMAVVDHVISNEGSNSVTTHVCFESHWGPGLVSIVTLFSVFVLVFFTISVCLLVRVVYLCRKNRSTGNFRTNV